MPFKDVRRKPNQSILKVYGFGENRKIKIITLSSLRTSGLDDDDFEFTERCSVNDVKLDESIIRAKNKIFELAFCNPWDYFFTGTLNPLYYDRSDLSKFHKDLTQWIRDQGKKLNCKIDFLLIPELHSDGSSWHLHGFIKGLPFTELIQFKVGDKMGKSLAKKVLAGDIVYNWLSYSSKFGFCDLEPIKNAEAISKYITKYINKGLFNSIRELNAHLYYHSRGLRTAEVIKKGDMLLNISPSFSNEYCSVVWLDYNEELLAKLQNSIVNIDYYNTRL